MGLSDFFFKKKQKAVVHNDVAINGKATPQTIVQSPLYVSTESHIENPFEKRQWEIRRLEKSSIPSANGLYPHEIYMLFCAPRYKTNTNNFPQFWHYEYAMDDPQAVLDMLLNRGFIRVTEAKENLNSLKVPQLKEILSSKGEKSTGKKADLISRVIAVSSEDELEQILPDRKYALTEFGEMELKANEYVTYFGLSMKYGLTVWDMNRMLKDYPKNLYRDKIWAELNRKTQEAMRDMERADYTSYVYNRYVMCKFLLEEDKHWDRAFNLLAEGAYYEFHLTAPVRYIARYNWYKNHGNEYNATPPRFSEFLSLDFLDVFKLQEGLGISNHDMEEMFWQFFRGCSLPTNALMQKGIPANIISDSEIASLIMVEMLKDAETAENLYQKSESKLNKLQPI